MLREKGKVLENTQRQLRHKENECNELKDQFLDLRLENKSPRYIMLCQDCRHDLDNKRPGDTAEEYSCLSCIGVAEPHREFPKDTWKMKQETESITKLGPIVLFVPFVLVSALLIFVWPFLPSFGLFSLSLIIYERERLVTPPSPIFYKRDALLSEV